MKKGRVGGRGKGTADGVVADDVAGGVERCHFDGLGDMYEEVGLMIWGLVPFRGSYKESEVGGG